MLNRFLEFMHNPSWVIVVFLLTFSFMLLDGYVIPLVKRLAGKTPQVSLDRNQKDDYLLQITWNFGVTNFLFVFSIIGSTYIQAFSLAQPNIRIVANILVAAALFTAIEKYRRAVKLKRQLKNAVIND